MARDKLGFNGLDTLALGCGPFQDSILFLSNIAAPLLLLFNNCPETCLGP